MQLGTVHPQKAKPEIAEGAGVHVVHYAFSQELERNVVRLGAFMAWEPAHPASEI